MRVQAVEFHISNILACLYLQTLRYSLKVTYRFVSQSFGGHLRSAL